MSTTVKQQILNSVPSELTAEHVQEASVVNSPDYCSAPAPGHGKF